MFRKLLPRNDDFFETFQRHVALIEKAATILFERSQAFAEIKACEEECDKITHHCISDLHKNFITPIERSDIHRLISKMDDVIDGINDVAKFLYLYKLPALENEALEISRLILEAVKEIHSSIDELRKKRLTDELQQHFLRISFLEGEADDLFVKGVAKLFDEEKDVLKIIKWKEILENLEETMNACDDVANILEGIILEYE